MITAKMTAWESVLAKDWLAHRHPNAWKAQLERFGCVHDCSTFDDMMLLHLAVGGFSVFEVGSALMTLCDNLDVAWQNRANGADVQRARTSLATYLIADGRLPEDWRYGS